MWNLAGVEQFCKWNCGLSADWTFRSRISLLRTALSTHGQRRRHIRLSFLSRRPFRFISVVTSPTTVLYADRLSFQGSSKTFPFPIPPCAPLWLLLRNISMHLHSGRAATLAVFRLSLQYRSNGRRTLMKLVEQAATERSERQIRYFVIILTMPHSAFIYSLQIQTNNPYPEACSRLNFSFL